MQAAIIFLLLVSQGVALFFLGQPFLSKTAPLMVWVGEVLSAENSQHLTDWYTFSHILHGIIFFWLLSFFRQVSFAARLCIAIGIEVSWEILENTPLIIDRYRETTLALGYSGDSIINSLSDTLAMIVGFFAAARIRVMYVLLFVIFAEIGVAYMIRDNLTLNILNLVAPTQSLQEWQKMN
jgi:hypothetical protein